MLESNKIRVIIADDEAPARDALRTYLTQDEGFEIVAECEDGLSAKNDIQQYKPDVVILDIQMPELTGMELLDVLKPPLPHIVFVTAYHEHAVAAFDKNAVDYILKPFDSDRFTRMMHKVRDRIKSDEAPAHDLIINALQKLSIAPETQYLKKLTIKKKGKIRFVPVEEIIWIESSGSFCKLHLADRMEISNFSIKELEQKLDPAHHIRIHKSHMISIQHIESIESYFHGEYIVTMSDESQLKLSRGYKGMVERLMNQY